MADAIVESNGIKYSYQRKTDANNKDIYYLYEITLPDTWSSDTPLSLVPYSKDGINYFPTVIGNSNGSTAVNIKYESSYRTKKLTGLKLTCDSNENIISIGKSAFSRYDALKSIDLSGCIGLTSIGENAFYKCGALTSINLSGCKTLETISNSAFADCSALTSINLSGCKKLTTIGISAFEYCSALTSINLSECTKLESIGAHAFFCCLALTSINLSGCEKLQTIGDSAFLYNPNLNNIIIENMNKDQLRSLIGILIYQVIDETNVKFVDKNMQICLSESNGQITDLIDYTQLSGDFLNGLLPNATFHYMCRYTKPAETAGSTGSAKTSLKTIYDDINNSKQIIKDTTTSDKVKLFYYGTDLDNPTQLQIYFNHDDYYNYITLDNTGNLKTLSDVKFVYITNNTKQFLAINKLSMDMLNNSLQLNKVQAKLSTTNEQIIKTQSELAETRTKISDTQTQLDKVKAININLQAQIDALQKK